MYVCDCMLNYVQANMEISSVNKPFPTPRFIHYGDFRYYYAYGNTQAEDLLQNSHGIKEPHILLLGCGDLRSCFYTLWKNFRSGISKRFEGVHFVLNDNSSAVVARDIIFLYLCLKMPQETAAFRKWISSVWAIWYSHELRSEHQQLLDGAIDNLIALSESSATWSSSANPLNKFVKFSSDYTLREVRQIWVMWHNREIGVKSVKRMHRDRLAELHVKVRDVAAASMGVVFSSLCTILIHNVPDATQKSMQREVTDYMRTGTSFAEDVLVDTSAGAVTAKTTINLTFYEREDGKYTMHYGSVPFKCFYHAVRFSTQQLRAAGVSRSMAEQLLVEDSHFESLPFLSNSVQQFALWLRSSATTLMQISSSSSAAPITFMFDYSDATDFCFRLQSPAFAQCLNCEACFDLVYSSNLADHLALPNLVLVVLPLIKPGGLLFTSTMLYKTVAPTAEECINILFGLDIKLIPVVFGVRCINHEGDPYSSVVSIQSEPYEYGHVVATKQWRKVLIWEKLDCLPLKHPTLLSKYDVITANLCSAVCNATTLLLKNVTGQATINNLCVETAMRMLHSFASRVDDNTSSHLFWNPLASLILNRYEMMPYMHCLQTQVLLHGIHLHLTVRENTCPLCLDTPLTSYLSLIKVKIEVPPGILTPRFLIYIHQGSAFVDLSANLRIIATPTPKLHIIDSVNGVTEGKQLTLHFHVPISLITEKYNFTVVSYILGQVLDREADIPTIITTKRLDDCKIPALSYSFLGTPPPNPAPVTVFGTLQIHAGDGEQFETVIAVNELEVPHLRSLSVHKESPTEIHLFIRLHKYVVIYPYPVDYEKLSIKISRKEKTVTILASRMAYAFELEKPLFVINTSDEFAKLCVPLSNQDMIAYCGMQFTKDDRQIMQQCNRSTALMPAIINLKESMNIFFQCQSEDFFNIAIPENDIHALVVVQDRVFDLHQRSPAIDMAFCFLDISFVDTVAIKWQSLAPIHATRCITVNETELTLLERVLMYFSRRTVDCSLLKAKGHLQLLKCQKIDQYFTRAVVYPLFADPDSYVMNMELMELTKTSLSSLLENSLLADNEVKVPDTEIAEEMPTAASDKKWCCANCGVKVSEMKKCANCGEVRYCSQECRKKHWKIHELDCKTSSSSKHSSIENSSSSSCLDDKSHCSCCGKKSSDLKKCRACSKSWYCNQECQKKDWKEHKKICKTVKEDIPASPGVLSLTPKSDTTQTKCAGCEKEFLTLRRCPCHKIAYCSTTCQRMDWERHKVDCTVAKKH